MSSESQPPLDDAHKARDSHHVTFSNGHLAKSIPKNNSSPYSAWGYMYASALAEVHSHEVFYESVHRFPTRKPPLTR